MPKKNNTITFNFVGDFTPSTKNDLLMQGRTSLTGCWAAKKPM